MALPKLSTAEAIVYATIGLVAAYLVWSGVLHCHGCHQRHRHAERIVECVREQCKAVKEHVSTRAAIAARPPAGKDPKPEHKNSVESWQQEQGLLQQGGAYAAYEAQMQQGAAAY